LIRYTDIINKYRYAIINEANDDDDGGGNNSDDDDDRFSQHIGKM